MRMGSATLSCRPALLVCLFASLVASCGFQLRGAAPISSALQPLAVSCDNSLPLTLCDAVKDQLRLGEVTLADQEHASYVLQLSKFSKQRRASAITQTAVAAEYDLRQSVHMTLITADKIPLVADQEINSSETYRYDETNVLAKQREEEAISESLNQRLAQQVIFRLVPLTQGRIDALRNDALKSTGNDAGKQP